MTFAVCSQIEVCHGGRRWEVSTTAAKGAGKRSSLAAMQRCNRILCRRSYFFLASAAKCAIATEWHSATYYIPSGSNGSCWNRIWFLAQIIKPCSGMATRAVGTFLHCGLDLFVSYGYQCKQSKFDFNPLLQAWQTSIEPCFVAASLLLNPSLLGLKILFYLLDCYENVQCLKVM